MRGSKEIVGFFTCLVAGVMWHSPANAQAWELEASEECTLHQKQGNLTVILSGNEEMTIFGYSLPSFKRLSGTTRMAFDVFFDGPALKGRDNKWGTVEMGIAPLHGEKALIFVTTPSFLKNLVKQATVSFQRVDNPKERTTIKLGSFNMGMDILEVCRRAG